MKKIGPLVEPPAACPFSRATAFGLFALLLSGCGLGDSDKAKAQSARKKGGRPPALVRVAEVIARKLPPTVTVVGTVVPKKTSIVASGADGIVQSFNVDEGQFVKEGTPLAELRMVTTDLGIKEALALLEERERELEELENGSRQEDVDEAEARMLAAQAIQENAARKLERARRLASQNAINPDELDDAAERSKAADQVHKAATAAWKRVVAGPRPEEIAQAAARRDAQFEHVEYLKAEKEKRITKAPFDGYVVSEETYEGQWLSKGDPVVTLAILDEVDVLANFDQWDLQHIRLGQTADVRVHGANPSQWEDQQIVALIPRSDWESGSRGFPVKVRLKSGHRTTDGKRLPVLKEGMMAEVTVKGAPVSTLLVPKDALVRTTKGAFIHGFTPTGPSVGGGKDALINGSTQQVPVRLGLSDGDLIQITVKRPPGERNELKIAAGSLVVVEGAERLRPVQQGVQAKR